MPDGEDLLQMASMAEMAHEFGGDLGDKRRTRRAQRCGLAIASGPSQSFPEIFPDEAELEAFYRLDRNEHIVWRDLAQPHVNRTIDRAKRFNEVLGVQDTTDLTYARYFSDRSRAGLSHPSSATQGFFVHFGALVSTEGRPVLLGVGHTQPFVHRSALPAEDEETEALWEAEGGLYENEAQRWFDAAEALEVLVADSDTSVIHVADREADSYGFLAWLEGRQSRFVIRCSDQKRLTNARVAGREGRFEGLAFVAELKVELGERSELRRGKKSKYHPPRKRRQATLSIRAAEIEIRRSRGRRDAAWSRVPWEEQPRTLKVHLVEVVEVEPPPGEHPVRWLLLTKEPIGTPEEIIRVVDIYLRRWVIEEYFKCLKTGCSIEKRQMDSLQNLLRVLALLVPCAWRLLLLRELGEAGPELSWKALLTPLEFTILQKALPKAKLSGDATSGEVLRAIASLGGHIKSNGRPGWQVLWRGWRRLNDYVKGARLVGINDDVEGARLAGDTS